MGVWGGVHVTLMFIVKVAFMGGGGEGEVSTDEPVGHHSVNRVD